MATSIESFHQLLTISGIRRVYFIDDYFSSNLDEDEVLVQVQHIIAKGNEEELKLKLQTEIDLNKVPADQIVYEIRKLIDGKTDKQKKDILESIISISDTNYIKETITTSKIVSHFPESVAEEVHPSKWDNIRANVLKQEIEKGGRVLILFDHDLSKAPGFEIRNGVDLIKELKKEQFFENIDCILISHDILDAKAELPRRKELINDNGDLVDSDFFPLSKKRLDVDDHFFDGIKKALINKYFEKIKSDSIKLIDASYKTAIKTIEDFDTYDFDTTILQTSLKEGVWAPETIFRISDIVFERELKSLMAKSGFTSRINSELKEVQKFSEIVFPISADMEPYSEKLFLRHSETYDPGEVINSLRKPLENGDIFEVGSNKYILVAQACDMMVRAMGNKKGARNAKTVTLLKITEQTYKDHKDKKRKDEEHYLRDKYPLPYFTSGTTSVGVVDFTNFLIIDIDFLDLCVLNSDGSCMIDFKRVHEYKKNLSLSWEARCDLLVEKLKPYTDRLGEFRKLFKPTRIQNIRKEIQRLLPEKILRIFARLSNGKKRRDIDKIEKNLYPKIVLASSNMIDNSFVNMPSLGVYNFAFKRVSKYKDHGATYLLERYTRHLSRIAEPHDFAFSKK